MAAALEATPWSATSPEPQDTALRGLQPATSRRTDCVVHPGDPHPGICRAARVPAEMRFGLLYR
jgi:hypothetical protein